MAGLKTFPQKPYFDDYSADKDYLRVLFRPGYAVQTREVNQLQTILQSQISRMGDYFFENGARVVRGECSVNNKTTWVSFAQNLSRTGSSYIRRTITSPNGAKAIIIAVVNSTQTDKDTIYILPTSASTSGSAFPGSGNYVIEHDDGSTESIVAGGSGIASTFSVDLGIYYFSGQFVLVQPQYYILNKYAPLDNRSSISMGFLVSHHVVTHDNDTSLLDNSTGTTNYSAPGAHRYKIGLTLTHKPTDATQNNYVEIARIIGGELTDKSIVDEYTKFQNILAERTFDESGDYVIDDFVLDVKEHLNNGTNRGQFLHEDGGDESKLVYALDAGRAYVRGYKVETTYNTYLTANKARTTQSNGNVILSFIYDSMIRVTGTSMFTIGGKVNLMNGASVIGSAIVRDVRFVSNGVVDLDLVNINMVGQTFGLSSITNVTQPISGATGSVSYYSYDATSSSLVYELPFGYVANFNGGLIYYKTEFNVTATGNSVSLSSPDVFGESQSDYVIQYTDASGSVVTQPTTVTRSSGNTVVTLGLPSTPVSFVKIVAGLIRGNATYRAKNLTTVTETISVSGNLQLAHTDGYKLVSVLHNGVSDITSSFKLDGGQRDTIYDYAKLQAVGGIPTTGTLSVTYSYFEHTAGDFFCKNSYGIPYSEIPSYQSSSGKNYFMGSVIDFRRSIKSDGGFDYTPGFASIFQKNSELICSYTTYLPRIDKIVVNKFGKFQVISGAPSSNPETPKDAEDALTLYTVLVNPYTFSSSDIKSNATKNRRYTMQDIGKLETRLETVEYYSALSLLEKRTMDQEFVGKFNTGFLVDNFKSQSVADAYDPELAVSYDLIAGEIRPQTPFRFVPLVRTNGTNTVVRDNLIMLNYVEVPYIQQNLCSEFQTINSFNVYEWNGSLTLSPSMDLWFTDEYLPDAFTDGGTFTVASNSASWETLAPSSIGGIVAGDVNTSESTQTQKNLTDIKEISSAPIPFMRSVLITVTGEGILPYSRLHFYFDDVLVDAHVRPIGGNYGDAVFATWNAQFTAEFLIPSEGFMRFRCGDKVLRVSDAKIGELPHTSAMAVFSAMGTLNKKQRNFVTTRTLYKHTTTQNFITPALPVVITVNANTNGSNTGYGPGTSDVVFPTYDKNTDTLTTSHGGLVEDTSNMNSLDALLLLNDNYSHVSVEGPVSTAADFVMDWSYGQDGDISTVPVITDGEGGVWSWYNNGGDELSSMSSTDDTVSYIGSWDSSGGGSD